jgi:hypothetical protein
MQNTALEPGGMLNAVVKLRTFTKVIIDPDLFLKFFETLEQALSTPRYEPK